MKKVIALLLALSVVFVLVGCSSSSNSKEKIVLTADNFHQYLDWDADVYGGNTVGSTFFADIKFSCRLLDGVEKDEDITIVFGLNFNKNQLTKNQWILENNQITLVIPKDSNSASTSVEITKTATNINEFEYYKEYPDYPMVFADIISIDGIVYTDNADSPISTENTSTAPATAPITTN